MLHKKIKFYVALRSVCGCNPIGSNMVDKCKYSECRLGGSGDIVRIIWWYLTVWTLSSSADLDLCMLVFRSHISDALDGRPLSARLSLEQPL
jgi:hypothetical protein